MTDPLLPDAPDVAPDVATRVQEFADLLASGQPVAASNAMLTWVTDCPEAHEADRTRYFATTATTLVATRLPAPTKGFWSLEPPILGVTVDHAHNLAMCQVVVRIANGEPDVALALLTAHKFVHGTAGLFWLGVCAVRLLADLMTDPPRERTR